MTDPTPEADGEPDAQIMNQPAHDITAPLLGWPGPNE